MSIWDLIRQDLDACEALEPRQAEADQVSRLGSIVMHHRVHSPRYSELLREAGLEESWVPQAPEDLSSLPIIDKEFLRAARFNECPGTDEPVTLVSTSGTTSAAAEIPHNESSLRAGLGENFARALVLGNLTPDRWCLIGHWDPASTERNVQVTGSFLSMAWLHDKLDGTPLLRNGATGMEQLADEVGEYRPDAIASSPNLLAALARTLLGNGDHLRLEGLLYGGASANDEHRKLWHEVFAPAKIVAFYPTTDAGAIGVSPKDNGRYLTFSETHLVEVVGCDGRHVKEGHRGRLVVTAFESRGAPIIRYAIGDEVTYQGHESNRVVVSDIARIAEVAIGDTLFPVSTVQEWATQLVGAGHGVEDLQLVVRRDELGRDLPVLRLHNLSTSSEAARAAAVGLYLSVGQLASEVREGAVAVPRTEVVVSKIGRGFKVSPVVDERADQPGGGGL